MNFWDKLLHPDTLACTMWQWEGTTFSRRCYGDIVNDARHVAAGLRRRGVGQGSIVPAVITNGPDAIAGFIGTMLAGATVASLPIIARGTTIANYARQLSQFCDLLGADFLLAEERFLAFMDSDTQLGVDVVGYRSLVETQAVGQVDPLPPDSTMFIQFSSGTTGDPRGVELTGRAIDAHLTILSESVGIDPERDVGYTWLPLSHDMGLFGCGLLGWYNGIVGVIATPERFLASPRSWFDDCAEFGATVTAGPPFALDVAARAESIRTAATPLSLRLCLVGAEQIRWETLVRASETFAPRGIELANFTPAYGLAEATLAVTVDDLASEPSFLDVAGDELASGTVRVVDPDDPQARRLVCVGTPLRTVEVEIEATDQEIVVGSSSLASGYYGNELLNVERFRDGMLHTGDHGFLTGERLFITGRSDDLLVIAGRNVYVQELEQHLGTDSDVRTGNCAVVTPSDGGPRAAILAETDPENVDIPALAARLHRAAAEQAGLSIHQFVFLPRGAFPKTPSGKVQRYRCRQLLADPTVGVRLNIGSRA
jgi:acyl-CoA synthetase (AMP-forming)/AMP-acid ligase II